MIGQLLRQLFAGPSRAQAAAQPAAEGGPRPSGSEGPAAPVAAAPFVLRPSIEQVPGFYRADGLSTRHNHDFMRDPRFVAAYARGMQAAGSDYGMHWRVHVALWVAGNAVRLPGDFVECGVNYGFMSSAIMHHLDWDGRDRTFWLLDTFAGLDEAQVSDNERAAGAIERNRASLASGHYVSGVERVRRNFSQWRNVSIIEGSIPGTLAQVSAGRVALLHLDMNCAEPEVAAAEHFWPRLVPGAMLLLDDYAFYGFEQQKAAMDDFARRHAVEIVALPTGQGLLIKPPEAGPNAP